MLHLLDQVRDLQEVSLGAIERREPAPKQGNVRGDPRLERRHELGHKLLRAHHGIVQLPFFEASLFDVGIALCLDEPIDLRGQGRGHPHD